LLVGDNPFHGISHLSQQRSREREANTGAVDHATRLVALSIENGADGFMFSVSETTLSILESLRRRKKDPLKLFALVPYAYEYVRVATQVGGISGLAKKIMKEILLSMNIKALLTGVKGVAKTDLGEFLKTYLAYEISRIRSSAGRQTELTSVLLHELITEMALALNLEWVFASHIDFMLKNGITPGFETRNFAFLVRKFEEWNIDFRKLIIASPFNKAGFQMSPSREVCEEALASLPADNVIAMSILAAGYVDMPEAVNYVRDLPNLKGIVVGVSKERHARETFLALRDGLAENTQHR
jgi:hypothetical protein